MKEILAAMVIVLVIVAMAATASKWTGASACAETGAATGYPTKHEFWSGCYIKPDPKTGWVPLASWITIKE